MQKELLSLFERDLDRLAKEIKAFKNEDYLWKISGEISNTPGNLAMHIAGNLQHFFGAVLGNNGYVRERENELNGKMSREEILAEIQKGREAVQNVLSTITNEALKKNYPLDVFGKKMSTTYFLIHLQGHLNYHLGQINYCRRILSA